VYIYFRNTIIPSKKQWVIGIPDGTVNAIHGAFNLDASNEIPAIGIGHYNNYNWPFRFNVVALSVENAAFVGCCQCFNTICHIASNSNNRICKNTKFFLNDKKYLLDIAEVAVYFNYPMGSSF